MPFVNNQLKNFKDLTIINSVQIGAGNRALTAEEAAEVLYQADRADTSTSSILNMTDIRDGADYARGYVGIVAIHNIIPTNERCIFEFSFKTDPDDDPPTFTDNTSSGRGEIYFRGDDCEDGTFVPEAGRYYDCVIGYRAGTITGSVAGYDLADIEPDEEEAEE